ncbi:hypothetical protein ACLOJK_005346 [Asimina triloba]
MLSPYCCSYCNNDCVSASLASRFRPNLLPNNDGKKLDALPRPAVCVPGPEVCSLLPRVPPVGVSVVGSPDGSQQCLHIRQEVRLSA